MATAVRRRRAELGLQQNELADLASVDVSTLRNIERSRRDSYDPVTLAKVSRALGWEPDGIGRLFAGDEPTEREEMRRADAGLLEATRHLTALESRVSGIERRLDRLDELVDRLLREARGQEPRGGA